MDTTTIIHAADTLAQAIAEEPVLIDPPTRHSIMHFFINGGAGYMSILTLFLIGIFIAAWKAPAWVRDLGFGALIASLAFVVITSYQIFGLVQQWSDMPFGVACGGIRCALIPLIYGLIIYLISILISIFQKPRI
ncbi:MAG: hypothetical protein IJ971_09925 [Bacteroidales bacterium]|nr:hypothetical protein [Bacteroidales bacterium]